MVNIVAAVQGGTLTHGTKMESDKILQVKIYNSYFNI